MTQVFTIKGDGKKHRSVKELAELKYDAICRMEAIVNAATDRLWSLAEDVEEAAPAKVRELVRQMVSRIDLYFDHVKKGTRVECPFSHGTITLRADPLLYRLVNRGDWI